MKELFIKLGLTHQESRLLEALFQHGEQTILELSRNSGVNRTNIYRLLESLTKEGFVVQNPKSKTSKYTACSPGFLGKKVDSKISEASHLEETYKDSVNEINNLLAKQHNSIFVKHYNGANECRQLIWNSLKSKDTIKSFGYRSLKEAVGIKFTTEWFNESMRREQSHQLLLNPSSLEIKTHADEDERYKFLPSKFRSEYEKRVIPIETMEIFHETFIYDDIYAVVQWKDDDIFGVEIRNKIVAKQQRVIFDHLWEIGEKV